MPNPYAIETQAVADKVENEDPKLSYAKALLGNPLDAHHAAQIAFPHDWGLQVHAVNHWQQDREVIDYKRQLLSEYGPESFLVTKEEMVHRLYHRMLSCRDDSDYAKLLEKMMEIRGWKQKDGVNVTTNIQMNVMKVPEYDSDEQWEQALMLNQSNLQRIALEQQRGKTSE